MHRLWLAIVVILVFLTLIILALAGVIPSGTMTPGIFTGGIELLGVFMLFKGVVLNVVMWGDYTPREKRREFIRPYTSNYKEPSPQELEQEKEFESIIMEKNYYLNYKRLNRLFYWSCYSNFCGMGICGVIYPCRHSLLRNI